MWGIILLTLFVVLAVLLNVRIAKEKDKCEKQQRDRPYKSITLRNVPLKYKVIKCNHLLETEVLTQRGIVLCRFSNVDIEKLSVKEVEEMVFTLGVKLLLIQEGLIKNLYE